MEPPFRAELLEDEKKRRDEVIAAAEKHRRGAADALTQQFDRGVISQFCAITLFNDKATGKYPLVSAAYQNWFEDYHAWFFIFKSKDGFNWPEPNKFGAPYSLVFLKEYYKETREEKEKRTQEQKRYPTTEEGGPSHAEVDDDLDDDANWDKSVVVPSAWYKDGVLTPVEHCSFVDAYNVWKMLFGDRLWPKGCQPFEIPIPKHVDPRVVLAAPEDLPELMFKLWKEFSTGEPWFIRIFVRYYQDPSARFGIRAWLHIDWPATQDIENPAWLRNVYYATFRLYTWYLKLLRGQQVQILEEIRSQSDYELKQHTNLFNHVMVREAVNAQGGQAKGTEGDKAVHRALYRKQQVTILALAFQGVEERMEATPDPDQKLQRLLQVIEDGMPPLPLSPDDRRSAVADAAKAILANAVRAVLGADNETIETRMSGVSEYLTLDANSAWGRLLPLGVRFEVIRGVLRQYEVDAKSQDFIDEWFEARSFMKDDYEFSGWDIGPLTESLRRL